MAKNRLELQPLRYFVAVAEEASLRRAAQRLHISQPPLTRSMHALEQLVGKSLLIRNVRGVSLTAEGKMLYTDARALLAGADQLLKKVRDCAVQAPPPVRIGASIGVTPALQRRFAIAWREVLAGAGMELSSDTSPRLARALRTGEIDFAVIGLPAQMDGLHWQPLYAEALVAALPREHPAARKKVVRLKDLEAIPFFWNPREFNRAFHDACARVFREAGFQPRYRVVEPGQLLTLERIGQGEGCTLVNRSRVPTRVPGLAYRPLAEGERLAIRYALAWRGETHEALGRRLATAARRRVLA